MLVEKVSRLQGIVVHDNGIGCACNSVSKPIISGSCYLTYESWFRPKIVDQSRMMFTKLKIYDTIHYVAEHRRTSVISLHNVRPLSLDGSL